MGYVKLNRIEYGEIAYEAYWEKCNGRSIITDDPLPEWELLNEKVKAAWESAAFAVISRVIMKLEINL